METCAQWRRGRRRDFNGRRSKVFCVFWDISGFSYCGFGCVVIMTGVQGFEYNGIKSLGLPTELCILYKCGLIGVDGKFIWVYIFIR